MMRSSWRPIALGLLAAACSSTAVRERPETVAAAGAPMTASDTLFRALHRLVVNGSIVADVQLDRNPPMAVGACLDPVAAARIELDRSLELAPEKAPEIVGALQLPRLPESLRDSELRIGVVMVRWVVDTTGAVVPTSVSIVSSPHGPMSVQVCGAILATRFTPARDEGRPVRAWVQMPVRFVP